MYDIIDVPVVCSDKSLIPQYMSKGATCLDVRAAENTKIFCGKTEMVRTGLKMAIPEGYEGIIRPRSGLAKKGLIIPNSPATIDQDYRGEVRVLLHNLAYEPFEVNYGDRIAQFTLKPIELVYFDTVNKLDDTQRGGEGFGSTGTQ